MEKSRGGRPPKPAGERAVRVTFTFTPELKQRLDAALPEGERSPFVAQAVERALDERGEGN